MNSQSKNSSWWQQVVFLFGTENGECQWRHSVHLDLFYKVLIICESQVQTLQYLDGMESVQQILKQGEGDCDRDDQCDTGLICVPER